MVANHQSGIYPWNHGWNVGAPDRSEAQPANLLENRLLAMSDNFINHKQTNVNLETDIYSEQTVGYNGAKRLLLKLIK